jgi:hypothetical protein
MAEKKKRPAPHPDDFMRVTLALDFQAKLNPKADDPPPFDAIGFESTLRASNAAEYLESVACAIRDKRLYGFMVQEGAESAVGAGKWIEKTPQEIIAEAQTHREKRTEKSGEKGDKV